MLISNAHHSAENNQKTWQCLEDMAAFSLVHIRQKLNTSNSKKLQIASKATSRQFEFVEWQGLEAPKGLSPSSSNQPMAGGTEPAPKDFTFLLGRKGKALKC